MDMNDSKDIFDILDMDSEEYAEINLSDLDKLDFHLDELRHFFDNLLENNSLVDATKADSYESLTEFSWEELEKDIRQKGELEHIQQSVSTSIPKEEISQITFQDMLKVCCLNL